MKVFRVPYQESVETDAGFKTTLHTVRILLAQKIAVKVIPPGENELISVKSLKKDPVDSHFFLLEV